MKRCNKCLLPETYPKISFNNDGICSYCSGKHFFGVEKDEKIRKLTKNKKILKKKFETFIKNNKGKTEYDCLLLFSGGKDSIYLLHILKEKYGLNVLAFSVDTGLMSPLAKKNIKKVFESLKVDHIFFTPEIDFFKDLYRFYLTNNKSEPFCDQICGVCSKVVHSIGLIEASKRKIPFVAIGLSPDQTDHLFYEISKEQLSQSWIPDELKLNKSNNLDLRYFWNPKKDDYIPRFIAPFHVINYPGEKAIANILEELEIINKNDLNSLKTNCYLAWLLHYLDLNKYGYTPYIKNISRNIQNKKINLNFLNKVYYCTGIKLLKHNIIKRADKDKALNYLNLNLENILKNKI
jgi:hypothetical protein